MDDALQELTGVVDFDLAQLNRKYDLERDRRLRSDGNSQYVKLSGDFSRYDEDPHAPPPSQREPLMDAPELVIIGGGFAGVMVAARLREQGFEQIRIIEKGGDFGGTWYWNRYPGVMCDTEFYVYMPLLEEPGYVPSAKYAAGNEIYGHVHNIGQHYGLYNDVCFQTAVTDLCWQEDAQRWLIKTDRGDAMRARFVVLATGLFERPKLPGIAGIEQFCGHTFHTSRWDYNYTGGSALQATMKLQKE